MNREGFVMLIITFIMLTTGLLDAMNSPTVIKGISAHSVWLAENMVTLLFVASALLLIAALSLHPMLKVKSNNGGFDVFTSIGVGVLTASAILSVSYLGGMLLISMELYLTR